MLDVKRLIQITLFALALVSSALLGLGLESTHLIVIAFIGATIGFVVTDLLRLFRIDGTLANIASIVILFLAMKDFFSEDSTGKLVSVAHLLVYLQTVLMFQEKTPRLNWQILVLSLLQVVVGTIFTLDLEAGLLFLVYFFVAGAAMVLQSVYSDTVDVRKRNRRAAKLVAKSSDAEARESLAPLLYFDPGDEPHAALKPMVSHLGIWLAVAMAFTSVMFYLVPRHTKPWYGPANIEVSTAGVSKSVDLNEQGLISLSNQLMFRVKFTDMRTGEPIELAGQEMYLRGLALSNLVIKNGRTDWQAPHDRISSQLYQGLPRSPGKGRSVLQTVTLEETADPLLYGVMPFYSVTETPPEVSFCHEVSALTRCQINDMIDMAPYRYKGATTIGANGKFLGSWPYVANTFSYSERPMYEDLPQQEWLTQMDPERYQSLVGISDILASEWREGAGSRLELMRTMEKYFLEPGRFQYTLDFRDVKRDSKLDPIEDFVRNHRSGHCELFASALTLMLRRQNIPARLVVGFYGAEQNTLNGGYLVRATNAHAWVEAYLPPEDCTQEMLDSGAAGAGGAWVVLDATPFSEDGNAASLGDNTMDLARTVWDDYVLGIDSEKDSGDPAVSATMFEFLQFTDLTKWEDSFKQSSKFFKSSAFKYTVLGIVGCLMFLVWLKTIRRRANVNETRKVGMLRRFVGEAISLIAPNFGAWVMDSGAKQNPTAFYLRLTEVLAGAELEREPSQTHREFAEEVATHFEGHPKSTLIQSTVREVTELFNDVRFGQEQLEPELCAQIEMCLDELKLVIKQPELSPA
ncbi:MAG: hypothetical protein ACI814_004155 [Mariniblastus sp.]|jgi:hypothetical protein